MYEVESQLAVRSESCFLNEFVELPNLEVGSIESFAVVSNR